VGQQVVAIPRVDYGGFRVGHVELTNGLTSKRFRRLPAAVRHKTETTGGVRSIDRSESPEGKTTSIRYIRVRTYRAFVVATRVVTMTTALLFRLPYPLLRPGPGKGPGIYLIVFAETPRKRKLHFGLIPPEIAVRYKNRKNTRIRRVFCFETQS